MELGKGPNDLRRDQFQEFAMQRQLVLVEVSEVSSQVLLKFYPL
jgi:hypothetical protein